MILPIQNGGVARILADRLGEDQIGFANTRTQPIVISLLTGTRRTQASGL
jgi:hypothetical protein